MPLTRESEKQLIATSWRGKLIVRLTHYLNGIVRGLPPAAVVAPSERARAEPISGPPWVARAVADDPSAPLPLPPPPYSQAPTGAQADAEADAPFVGRLRNGAPPMPPLAICFAHWASTRANKPPTSYERYIQWENNMLQVYTSNYKTMLIVLSTVYSVHHRPSGGIGLAHNQFEK